MRVAALSVAFAVVLSAPATARADCSYEHRVADISDCVVAVGEDAGAAIDNAADKTNAELARQFGSFGRRLRRNEVRTNSLVPPQSLASLHSRFLRTLAPPRRDLFGIAHAAKVGDPTAAGRATRNLVRHAEPLRRVRRALMRRINARLAAGTCETGGSSEPE